MSNVSLKDSKLAETISDNTEFPLLPIIVKVNVTFAIYAMQPSSQMFQFLNVPLIALLVNKAVLILAMLEKLHVLLVAFTLVF